MSQYIDFNDTFYTTLLDKLGVDDGDKEEKEKAIKSFNLLMEELVLDANLPSTGSIPYGAMPLLLEASSMAYRADKLKTGQEIGTSGPQEIKAVTIGDTKVEYSSGVKLSDELTEIETRRIDLYKRLVRRLRRVPW